MTNDAHTKPTFVILEDEVLAASELAAGLEESGFKHLGSFTTGEQLLESIHALRPDILLVDITLAGKLDGIQTVMRLPKELPSRVIFLTGSNDEETLRRAILLRPHAYLLKPLEVVDVRSTILTTLARDPEVEAELLSRTDVPSAVTGEQSPDYREPYKLMLAFPKFAQFGEEMISKLTGRAVMKEGEAGTFIVEQGQKSPSAFMMLSGIAMCCRQGKDGRQLTIHASGPGDPFGLMLALPTLQEQVSVRLAVNARYLSFPIDDVRHAIANFPDLSKLLLEHSCTLISELGELSAMIAYAKVEERLIKKILVLLDSIGRPLGGSKGTKIFITRKELAELAGTTVETAIRATKTLERKGILDLTRPGIIVVPSKTALLDELEA